MENKTKLPQTWYIGDLTEPDVTSNLLPLESNAISCQHFFKLSGLQNLSIEKCATKKQYFCRFDLLLLLGW